MSIQNESNEWRKVEKVILSCKNKEHLEAAFRYFKLFYKKHKFHLTHPRSVGGAYVQGRLHGLLIGMLQQYL